MIRFALESRGASHIILFIAKSWLNDRRRIDMQFLVRIGVFAALLLSMQGCSDRDIEYIEAVDPPDTADNSRLASQTGAPLFLSLIHI